MAERNVDKVKRLEYELGRWQDKVARLQKENAGLKNNVDKGLAQLTDMFRSVLVSIALTYGREAPEGTYTIEMPVGHTTGNKLNFDVDIKRTDYDTSVVTVTEKTKDKEAGGNV